MHQPRTPSTTAVAGGGGGGRRSHQHGGVGQQSQDTFPKLNVEEIRQELHRLQIELPPTFWKDPQPEEAQGLYSLALEFVMCKTIQEIRIEELSGDIQSALPSVNGLDVLPHDGCLHIRAVGNLRFFRYCQYLCRTVLGILDFCWNDLFRPSSDRVQRFASAFVNYMRFQEHVLSNFQPQLAELEQLGTTEKEVEEEHRVSTNELNQAQFERDHRLAEVHQRHKMHEMLVDKLQELNAKFTSSSQKLEDKVKQLERLQMEMRDREFRLTASRQRKQDLEDQVVHSPEKLQQEMAELEAEDVATHGKLSAAESRKLHFKTLLQRIQKSSKRLKIYNERCLSHLTLLKNHAEFRSSLKGMEKNAKEAQNEIMRISEERKRVEIQIEGFRTRLEANKQTWSEKHEKILGMRSAAVERADRRREQSDKHVEATKHLEHEIKVLEETHEKQMEDSQKAAKWLEEWQQKLLDCFEDYQQFLQKAKERWRPWSLSLDSFLTAAAGRTSNDGDGNSTTLTNVNCKRTNDRNTMMSKICMTDDGWERDVSLICPTNSSSNNTSNSGSCSIASSLSNDASMFSANAVQGTSNDDK